MSFVIQMAEFPLEGEEKKKMVLVGFEHVAAPDPVA
jgi:hypothetical protein